MKIRPGVLGVETAMRLIPRVGRLDRLREIIVATSGSRQRRLERVTAGRELL
jgi:hypothetical protein